MSNLTAALQQLNPSVADHQQPGDSAPAQKAQTLLLIDGFALVYRAYWAFQSQGMQDPQGEPTGTVYGYVQMILSLVERLHPDYVIVAFEYERVSSGSGSGSGSGGTPNENAEPKTFRHALYPAYKATRKDRPAEITAQLERIRFVTTQLLGIPLLEVENYEADDVIASLVQQATTTYGASLDVVIATGDRDLLQLVGEHTRVLLAGQSFKEAALWGPGEVKEKYAIDPYFLTGYKALVGDKSDNIEGAPGIGPVAAARLLNQIGTLENILSKLYLIKSEKVSQVLADHQARLNLNLKLVRLVSDLNVTLDLGQARLATGGNVEEALRFLRGLDFPQVMLGKVKTFFLRVQANELEPASMPSPFPIPSGTKTVADEVGSVLPGQPEFVAATVGDSKEGDNDLTLSLPALNSPSASDESKKPCQSEGTAPAAEVVDVIPTSVSKAEMLSPEVSPTLPLTTPISESGSSSTQKLGRTRLAKAVSNGQLTMF